MRGRELHRERAHGALTRARARCRFFEASEIRNQAVLDYLHTMGFADAFAALQQQTGLEYVDDGKQKYSGLLEKKWTSVLRLQKKVSDRATAGPTRVQRARSPLMHRALPRRRSAGGRPGHGHGKANRAAAGGSRCGARAQSDVVRGLDPTVRGGAGGRAAAAQSAAKPASKWATPC